MDPYWTRKKRNIIDSAPKDHTYGNSIGSIPRDEISTVCVPLSITYIEKTPILTAFLEITERVGGHFNAV